jgi:hypothetical protein
MILPKERTLRPGELLQQLPHGDVRINRRANHAESYRRLEQPQTAVSSAIKERAASGEATLPHY